MAYGLYLAQSPWIGYIKYFFSIMESKEYSELLIVASNCIQGILSSVIINPAYNYNEGIISRV
jgi:hypothetical protein